MKQVDGVTQNIKYKGFVLRFCFAYEIPWIKKAMLVLCCHGTNREWFGG